TGMEVVYRHGPGGTDIGGLTSGKTYFVIKVDNDKFKLAATSKAAMDSNAIDFTAPGTGTRQQVQGFAPVSPNVQVDDNDPALGDLLNLEDIKFDDVVGALSGLSGFLDQFSQLPFLNDEIPLLGIRFNDLVNIAANFEKAVVEIVKDPA